MKSLKRRLLSLFMAMVMVLSLAPGALAVDEVQQPGDNEQKPPQENIDNSNWSDTNADHQHKKPESDTTDNPTVTEATCTEAKKKVYKCTETNCNATLTETEGKPKGHTWATTGTEITTGNDKGKHKVTCTVQGCNGEKVEEHDWNTNDNCKVCNAEKPAEASITLDKKTLTFEYDDNSQTITATTVPENAEVEWSVSPATGVVSLNATGKSCTVSVTGYGSATIAAKVKDSNLKAECNVTVDNPLTITSSSTNNKLTSMDSSITLIPYFDGKAINTVDGEFTWKLPSSQYFDFDDGDRADGKLYVTPLASSKDSRSCTITAEYKVNDITYKESITLHLQISAEIDLTASVSTDYYFSEVSDKGSYSVEDQLLRAIPSNYYLDYIKFSNVTTDYGDLDGVSTRDEIYEDEIGDILFVPEKKGTAVFHFIAYTYKSSSSSSRTEREGILTITVTDASDSSGDVVFYGDVGEDVSLDSGSFEDFWDDEYPNGELEYVTFSVSGGTLRDADGKTVGSKKCYVRAGRNEIELDEVYFEPNSTNKKTAKTVSFSFTAYGENKSGTNREASGRVSIVYTAENPDDITYTSGSNGTVSLKASDFTAAYKEVISGSVPSNLTIVFQSVPKNGTLTYNDSSKKNAKDVKLTSSNIKKYSFTTKSSGSNQLNDIVYSGTSGTDTIDYIAYSGSTIKFKGSVVFNGKGAIPQDVVVYYASTAGQPARFSQNDFTTANSAMSKAAKIRFVTPANGTLYLNGSTTAAGIDIAPALLYSVTYQPKAGFNGTDKVVFAAYDASNNLVANGSVNITVAGNPTTGTTPGGTTNPGGVTDVSQFTDVSGNAWYRANLATLVSKGVISGRGDGKFDPKGTVTYGEALKMVLESCGYTAAVGTGSQWAINYKNLAVSKGWISSSVDLNAAISRNATAELAAKVLGVAPVTSGSPFGDEANAYAVALYYTTPQIFVGTTNPNGGKPLFENNKPLLREQVCAVICRVSDYHTQHTTNVMPDGV